MADMPLTRGHLRAASRAGELLAFDARMSLDDLGELLSLVVALNELLSAEGEGQAASGACVGFPGEASGAVGSGAEPGRTTCKADE